MNKCPNCGCQWPDSQELDWETLLNNQKLLHVRCEKSRLELENEQLHEDIADLVDSEIHRARLEKENQKLRDEVENAKVDVTHWRDSFYAVSAQMKLRDGVTKELINDAVKKLVDYDDVVIENKKLRDEATKLRGEWVKLDRKHTATKSRLAWFETENKGLHDAVAKSASNGRVEQVFAEADLLNHYASSLQAAKKLCKEMGIAVGRRRNATAVIEECIAPAMAQLQLAYVTLGNREESRAIRERRDKKLRDEVTQFLQWLYPERTAVDLDDWVNPAKVNIVERTARRFVKLRDLVTKWLACGHIRCAQDLEELLR